LLGGPKRGREKKDALGLCRNPAPGARDITSLSLRPFGKKKALTLGGSIQRGKTVARRKDF